MRRSRKQRIGGACVLSFAAIILANFTGCTGEFGEQFRAAAGPQLESGVNALLDGLVEGAFAIYEPDENDETQDTDSDNSGGS